MLQEYRVYTNEFSFWKKKNLYSTHITQIYSSLLLALISSENISSAAFLFVLFLMWNEKRKKWTAEATVSLVQPSENWKWVEIVSRVDQKEVGRLCQNFFWKIYFKTRETGRRKNTFEKRKKKVPFHVPNTRNHIPGNCFSFFLPATRPTLRGMAYRKASGDVIHTLDLITW